LIALLGIVATLLAYWALVRYVVRRVPQRRVRRGECPFCGYPSRANVRCEGRARELVAPCTACEAPRRVGTPFCGHCGSAAA
jgi:transcription elongation factor Elf1